METKKEMMGVTFQGSVTFQGPMFDIHDNQHVTIVSREQQKTEAGEESDIIAGLRDVPVEETGADEEELLAQQVEEALKFEIDASEAAIEAAEAERASKDQDFDEPYIPEELFPEDDEIEEILKDVEVVDVEQKRGKPSVVSFGCSVKIKNVSTGKEKSITLKSSSEAQSLAGVISDESPLGRALAGAKKGAVVSFDAPAGVQEFEVVDIWVEKDR